jgi:MFS transporter, FSR family, fosmidomycin resistance protein
MLALSGGHLAVDFASGSVPALIPFLTTRYHLSYTLAGLLLLAATASSSRAQPLFGWVSDRRAAIWLLPVGAGLAATGVGVAAVAPSYLAALLLVLLGGIGIAAFHPEAAKCAAYASGERRATGMSYFNIGGNSGYALGALLTGGAVASIGSEGGLLAMIPVLVAALALTSILPQLSRLRPVPLETGAVRSANRFPAMANLAAVIALRSIAWFALLAFAPLWLVAEGHTGNEGNRLLFLMLLGGAVGTLVLGAAADKIGLRRMLVLTQTAIAPLILAFVYVGGVVGVTAATLVGFCVVGTFGVTMVLSQLYLPRNVGVASGLSIGLAMGIGGIAAVGLGAIADAINLKAAFTISAAAPLIGVFFCFRLPPGPAALSDPTDVVESSRARPSPLATVNSGSSATVTRPGDAGEATSQSLRERAAPGQHHAAVGERHTE